MSRRRGGLFGYWPGVCLLALGLFLLLTSSFFGVAHAALGTISLTLTTYDHDGLPGAGTVDFGDVYPDTPSTVSPAVVASVASDLEWRMTAVTGAIPEGCLLEQRPQGGASWTTLSPTTSVIAAAEPPASPDIQGYELRLTPSWDLMPGTYALQVTYSVAFTDQIPPAGQVTINAGGPYTQSASVTLSPLATDDSGVVEGMCFSNDNVTWSAWQTYSTTATWTLSAADGQKTVWAKFRDRAGNESTGVSASIVVDSVAPVISGTSVPTITDVSATISWQTNEPADTQVDYGLTTSYGLTTPLDPAAVTSHVGTLTGLSPATLYNFRPRSADPAGNLSLGGNSTFLTLTSRPLNLQASRSGKSANVTLTWSAVVGAASYRLYWQTQAALGGTWSEASTVDVSRTSYTHSQSPSTLYYRYYVRAFNSQGNLSAPSDSIIVNPP